MSAIPCKKRKCILYPACKHKTHIVCDDLIKYWKSLISSDVTVRYKIAKGKRGGFKKLNAHELWHKYIINTLPELLILDSENNPDDKYISGMFARRK